MHRSTLSFVLVFLVSFSIQIKIRDQEVSTEELAKRVEAFNAWYHELNPQSKHLEAKLMPDNSIKLITNEPIKENDVYITVKRDCFIRNIDVYETKYGESIHELEETFGYDDIANYVIWLISEIHNPESKWKPYLDILPIKPAGLVADYWTNKAWIEQELKHTSIPKKAFERRLMIDKKARNIHDAYTKTFPSLFDKEVFSIENIDWAITTIESRLIFLNFEGFLLPMLDLMAFGANKINPSKVISFEKDDNFNFTFKAISSFGAKTTIYDNPGFSNERLLVSTGKVSVGSTTDCYNIVLSFSGKKDDNLSKKRAEFFSKYFMFDQGHFDVIEECISPVHPYNRRFLFFNYVLMMDKQDLELPDPKRSELEQDRILLEYVISQFRTQLLQFDGSISDLSHRVKIETEPMRRSVLEYKIGQLQLLTQLIGVYEDNYYRLIKEDSL